MLGTKDIECGEEYNLDVADTEREALLPDETKPKESPSATSNPAPYCSRPRFGILHLIIAFLAGTLACFLGQYVVCGSKCFSSRLSNHTAASSKSDLNVAPPYVGSTERHHFPPTSPTNVFPSLFPTGVGHAGGTPTGAEPALIATAPSYPIHTGAAQLVVPASLGNTKSKVSHGYDLFRKWGNLSPWYSVDRMAFGLDSGPETPETCRITGLHFLHRHGARYPTAFCESFIFYVVFWWDSEYKWGIAVSYGGPAYLAGRLHDAAAQWTASGELEFLNEWCA